MLEFLFLSWDWATTRLGTEWLLSLSFAVFFTLPHSFLCRSIIFVRRCQEIFVHSRSRGHQQSQERFLPSSAWWTNEFTQVTSRSMCEGCLQGPEWLRGIYTHLLDSLQDHCSWGQEGVVTSCSGECLVPPHALRGGNIHSHYQGPSFQCILLLVSPPCLRASVFCRSPQELGFMPADGHVTQEGNSSTTTICGACVTPLPPPLQNCYSFSSMSFIIFLTAALEIKCRASHMPGKCSASDLYARSFEPFRCLFLVLHMVRLQLHSLGCRWAASPVPLCQEGCPFPIEWSWGICWKLINHTLWFVPFVCVSVSRPVPHCSD